MIEASSPRPSALSRVSSSDLLRAIWRYRAGVLGLAAIVLAVLGELLMRTSPGGLALNAALGSRLVQVAVLLVGLVSWVRDGLVLRGRQSAHTAAAQESAAPLPARRVVSRAASPRPPSERYVAFRARLGWRGTTAGLAAAIALGVACVLLLLRDFADPFAPWLWLAMIVVLLITFAGVRPASSAQTLLTHDPHEPAAEPPVSRAEWLAVGVILMAALLLRIWNLEYIPTGPYADEGDRALDARRINQGLPITDADRFYFFGTGWWGVPSLYFWLVAQSLNVFGDSLAGARMVHALSGVGAVWFTYRTARAAWSPRAGLLAGALLAVSDFAIHFSRTAGESAVMIFTWAGCFYFLYKGLKSLRPLDFALCGLMAGLTLYSYVPGKLLPPLLAVVGLYLLLRWGLKGARLYLPGLALAALVAALIYAPNALYVLGNSQAFGMRYNSVSIFGARSEEVTNAYRTDNWSTIVPRQFALSYAAFDVGQERGPFYPTRQPVLPVPWAALWLLGGAYALWRVGDARYALLGLWVLGGLAAAALTIETPSVQRVAGMVPTLAIVPALFLDRVASGIPALRLRLSGSRWSRAPGHVVNAALALLVALLGAQTVLFYFRTYAPEAHFEEFTLLGRYMQRLDPEKDVVYQSGMDTFLGTMGPTLFLARGVPLRDLGNLGDEFPLHTGDFEGKNVHFVFFPANDPTVTLLSGYYPGGTREIIYNARGAPFLAAFRVSEEEILSSHEVQVAYYNPPSGPRAMLRTSSLGTLPQAGGQSPPLLADVEFPASAEWSGGLIVPAYGSYSFSLNAPGGALLQVGGRVILSAPPGSREPVKVRVVLAKGAHPIRLSAALPDANSPVELRWSVGDEEPVPVARRFLWSGPTNGLWGRYYTGAGGRELLGLDALPLNGEEPFEERRDGLLSWRDIVGGREGGEHLFAVWEGTFSAVQGGRYLFDLDTDGAGSLWIDGEFVGGRRVPGSTRRMPAPVELSPGSHRVEVRFSADRRNNRFGLHWQPPGGEMVPVPNPAFGVPEGGVYTSGERSGVPAPNVDLNPQP